MSVPQEVFILVLGQHHDPEQPGEAPWVRVPHLASHLLSRVLRRLSQDWQNKYGHPIYLVETFVEAGRFAGTSYQADQWGETEALRQQGQNPERWRWVYMGTVFRLDQRGQTAGQRAVITERGYVNPNGSSRPNFHVIQLQLPPKKNLSCAPWSPGALIRISGLSRGQARASLCSCTATLSSFCYLASPG
jgi:hypothetical protein